MKLGCTIIIWLKLLTEDMIYILLLIVLVYHVDNITNTFYKNVI